MNNQQQARLKILAEKLRARGQRVTPQRMAILRVLASNADHPSIDEIHHIVKQDFPMTSLATVYKTIATLKELGEVTELSFGNGANRYDGCNTHLHPHIICVKCNHISDINIAHLDDLSKTVANETGYQIIRQRLDFFGICPECQKKYTS